MQQFPEPRGDDRPVTAPGWGSVPAQHSEPSAGERLPLGEGTGPEPAHDPAYAQDPASPQGPPPYGPTAPRRRRRWPWVAGALAFVLVLAGGSAIAWEAGKHVVPAKPVTHHNVTAPKSTGGGGLAEQHRAAVAAVLATRSQAVLRHDKAGFLAGIDPVEAAFRSRQATLFGRIAKVPLASWGYDYAGEGPALPSTRLVELPKGSWVARVILHYKYAGGDSPVDREQYLTFVPRGGRWLLGGDDDVAASGLKTERDIWDLSPVNVVTGSTSLVIGDASTRALEGYARDADRSVRDVDATWKAHWSRRPVVIVPRTQADMATIIGSDGAGLDQIAAVTTGYSVSGPTRGDRIVINPAAWKSLGDLGQRVVMSHELTHLATRAITLHSVPIWMSEGFADYVAYKAVDVPTDVVASDVLDEVRQGKGPKQLPDDSDFDAARGDLAPAYEGAWLACRMIAAKWGEKKLIALYLAFADRAGGLPEKDIRSVLGISQERFVADWRAYLKVQARK